MPLLKRLITPASWDYLLPEHLGPRTRTALLATFGYPVVGALCFGATLRMGLGAYHIFITLLLTLAILLLLFRLLDGRTLQSYWQALTPGKSRRAIRIGIQEYALALLIMPVVGLVNSWLGRWLGYTTGPQLQPFAFNAVTTSRTMGDFLLAWGSTALLPPLLEELVVRGVWMVWLRRYGWGVALAGSTLYFAILHVSHGLYLPTATLGVLFAVATIRARHIGAGILAHILWNTTALLVAFLRA